MNSQERREARYQRRKARRQARREARCAALGPVDRVFSYRKTFFYGRKCCNGVRWKQSIQNFEPHLFSGTAKRRKQLRRRKWNPRNGKPFTLKERGKVRHIDPPPIADRQIEKTLSNEVLVPLYTPSMIYDNGASQKGKGLHWQFRRLEEQLHWHYRKFGRTGAMGLVDLKGFFPQRSETDDLSPAPAVYHKSRSTVYRRHRSPKLAGIHPRARDAAGTGAKPAGNGRAPKPR